MTPRERATIIVALLYWQASTKGQDRKDYLGFAREVPLTDPEINALVERLDREGMQESCRSASTS